VILFPEGSRGEPERLGEFKTGVAHLARRFPTVPFVPIFLHGLGKALPRGEALLVPFFCDVFIGEPLVWTGDKAGFMQELTNRITGLAAEGNFPAWE
jgi:1-acyl-sn-glycerol-3-phosphate acyltransferase